MITHIILHHSASPKINTTAKDINQWHKTRNWGTILKPIYLTKQSSLEFWAQYQYVIETDGLTIQCRKDDEIGWHTGGDWNTNSIGICLCGNFEIEKPEDKQIFALRDLLSGLCKKYNIPVANILGHRDCRPTLCPGKNIDIQFIRNFIEIETDVVNINTLDYLKSEILKLLNNAIEEVKRL